MTNQDPDTRKNQVLKRLRQSANEWVDGPELATEKVGGSEGLRRVRELAAEGHRIIQRKHPDPARDIWQYQLVVEVVSPLRSPRAEPVPAPVGPEPSMMLTRSANGEYAYVPANPAIPALSILNISQPYPAEKFVERLPDKLDFGTVAVCPRCHARTRKRTYPALFGTEGGPRHKDPLVTDTPCRGCNGFGVVPNKGPIPLTLPDALE